MSDHKRTETVSYSDQVDESPKLIKRFRFYQAMDVMMDYAHSVRMSEMGGDYVDTYTGKPVVIREARMDTFDHPLWDQLSDVGLLEASLRYIPEGSKDKERFPETFQLDMLNLNGSREVYALEMPDIDTLDVRICNATKEGRMLRVSSDTITRIGQVLLKADEIAKEITR